MRIAIKILQEVDGLEVGSVKNISAFHANELIRNGVAEIYAPNKETEESSTKSKKAKAKK
jgi:hypothetical protein